jgi:hypothetical protein
MTWVLRSVEAPGATETRSAHSHYRDVNIKNPWLELPSHYAARASAGRVGRHPVLLCTINCPAACQRRVRSRHPRNPSSPERFPGQEASCPPGSARPGPSRARSEGHEDLVERRRAGLRRRRVPREGFDRREMNPELRPAGEPVPSCYRQLRVGQGKLRDCFRRARMKLSGLRDGGSIAGADALCQALGFFRRCSRDGSFGSGQVGIATSRPRERGGRPRTERQ